MRVTNKQGRWCEDLGRGVQAGKTKRKEEDQCGPRTTVRKDGDTEVGEE